MTARKGNGAPGESAASFTEPETNAAESIRPAAPALAPSHNTDHEALTFLRLFAPAGPWDLIAFPAEGGAPVAQRFGPETEGEAARWIEAHGKKQYNLYYHVNPNSAPNAKAKKADVTEVRYLHVDLDPKPGEPWADEQSRLLDLLTEKRPGSVPRPTFIISSGNGYQALWLLDEPVRLNGREAAAEDIECYTRWLEGKLGGDNTHDVTRVLRLPGTVNLPNAKKRAAGRTPQKAELILHDPDNVASLINFSKAPKKGEAKAGATTAARVNVDAAKIPRFEGLDVEPLRALGASDRALERLVVGYDADKYDSPEAAEARDKSSDTFFICCQLIRDGLTDEQIAGVLLNKDWKGNAHIFKPGTRNSDLSYVQQQIGHAHSAVGQPAAGGDTRLAEINERFFLLHNEGGKARVGFFEDHRGFGRRLVTQSHEDFKKRFSNCVVLVPAQNGTRSVALGTWWLAHPGRRQYERAEFAPGEDLGPSVLNLWEGFAVEPRAGSYPWILEHLRENLCGGDEEQFQYLWRWFAWKAQNPGLPCEVALVMRGGKGTGKGTVGRMWRRIFGPHMLSLASSDQFTGKFNGHLRACALLFSDEATRPTDKAAESRLKAYVTEDFLAIEPKGLDVIQCRNAMGIIIATNEEWAVPASLDERRFAVFDVDRRRDRAFYQELHAEISGDGAAALLADLLAVDLGDWHPRYEVPQTKALADQKLESLGPIEQMVLRALETGAWPDYCLGADDGRLVISTSELVKHAGLRGKQRSLEMRAKDLITRLGGQSAGERRVDIVNDRGLAHARRGTYLPELAEMRAAWERITGLPVRGDDCTTWLVPERLANQIGDPDDLF